MLMVVESELVTHGRKIVVEAAATLVEVEEALRQKLSAERVAEVAFDIWAWDGGASEYVLVEEMGGLPQKCKVQLRQRGSQPSPTAAAQPTVESELEQMKRVVRSPPPARE